MAAMVLKVDHPAEPEAVAQQERVAVPRVVGSMSALGLAPILEALTVPEVELLFELPVAVSPEEMTASRR
jgi:hypothetical protein